MRNDLDDLLNRYRPAGPPPDLRARVLDAAVPSRAWPWGLAAAALLVVSIGLRAGSDVEMNQVQEPVVDVTTAAIDQLASVLGGGEQARVVAESIILQEQIRAARAAQATETR